MQDEWAGLGLGNLRRSAREWWVMEQQRLSLRGGHEPRLGAQDGRQHDWRDWSQQEPPQGKTTLHSPTGLGVEQSGSDCSLEQ